MANTIGSTRADVLQALKNIVKRDSSNCVWNPVQLDDGRFFDLMRLKVAIGTYYKRDEQ